MNAELLNLLSPEERAAWALCEGATPGPWVDMTSAGPDVGAFDGEIRAALSFTHICSDVPGDDRENDRAFIAGSRDALPLALTTIATLRADLAEVQARYGRAWEALCTIGDAVDKAGHYTLIPERALHVGNAVNALIDEADELRTENTTLRETLAEQQRAFVIGLDLAQRTADAEIAELRATLDNDRGEGEPPSEGWAWNGACDAWYLRKGVIVAAVERWTPSKELPYWTMATDADYGREVRYQSARAAMKAADDAVKGAT